MNPGHGQFHFLADEVQDFLRQVFEYGLCHVQDLDQVAFVLLILVDDVAKQLVILICRGLDTCTYGFHLGLLLFRAEFQA